MSIIYPRTRRWTRAEYDRLIDHGMFRPDERLELLAGHLCVREPQNSPHAMAIALGQEALQKALAPGWHVRVQLPVALDDESEPEPDLAVVSGVPRDYTEHPSRPVLVIEIADSSLNFDRAQKGSLYARAGVPEYWIVNIVDHLLEVYRDVGANPNAPHGWAYRSVQALSAGERVTPLAVPSAAILVADLLP